MKWGMWFAGVLCLAGCASTRPVKGEAVVKCVITKAGRAEGCEVKKRDGAVSDDQLNEALRLIHAREYPPVRYNGKPVDMPYTFRFTYRDPLPTDGGVSVTPAEP
ncbi:MULTISPECIES: energy transducer TonB [unclassified Corallococcus]|uniref:energy transducer TonB n=1 Tax=unclassified Corallococcus TaxID=2685029 RepID=UPI001A8D2AA6|nr:MULTISPECIES: energy transducer TonB [unclassified Corallococcus]MBN9681896.1 energy transducer TonB [Corallococcus sp. NCSPR001]WAS86537.1 energy transducer TonB [Corallococcus sp. NCRR]